jgi:hypothetical protein
MPSCSSSWSPGVISQGKAKRFGKLRASGRFAERGLHEPTTILSVWMGSHAACRRKWLTVPGSPFLCLEIHEREAIGGHPVFQAIDFIAF